MPRKILIKNTQVVLQEPGYWVDGKWIDGTEKQMQEYYKLLDCRGSMKSFGKDAEWI